MTARGSNSRPPPETRPESSWTIIHFAMSAEPDMIPPAGLVLSLRNGATGRTVPSTSACVAATLPVFFAPEWSTSLFVIPTFWRIRFRTKSSQLCPETASITLPATR
jgi:hypothetical protein